MQGNVSQCLCPCGAKYVTGSKKHLKDLINDINCIYCLNKSEVSTMVDATNADITPVSWSIGLLARRWILALVHHHQLHQPEHVGMFAGSLLSRSDWDHN
jgi:hypothetical protein